MTKKKQTPPLMLSPAVCGFPSPAELYVDAPVNMLSESFDSTELAIFQVEFKAEEKH